MRLRRWWDRLPEVRPKRWIRAAYWSTLHGARRRRLRRLVLQNRRRPGPPPLEPVWPLPRAPNGPSEEEIRARFAAPNLWHYDFRFEGGLAFPSRHATPTPYFSPEQPLDKFGNYMPWLLQETGGTLAGKRVLDIGCNSGFWAVQCALLGAREVVGFDIRREMIDQANFVKAVAGLNNVRFRVLDFWDMNPETLDGAFDVVLNLSVLFHLPDPLEVLKRTRQMAREYILLETLMCRDDDSVIRLNWREPKDIHHPAATGIVAMPSKSAMELMLRHLGFSRCMEIPIRIMDADTVVAHSPRCAWLVDAASHRDDEANSPPLHFVW